MPGSKSDLQPGQGLAQHLVAGVAAAGCLPDAAGLVALAGGPQHFAQMGGNLGVGPGGVGLTQQAQRFLLVAQADVKKDLAHTHTHTHEM